MEENNIQKNEKIGGKSIAWILPLIGYPVTITGLILGCTARKNEKNAFSLTGIILSSITLGITLINSIMGIIIALSLYY